VSVTVVGLGKIGLPLAVQFARSGMTVIGADTNPAVVDLVNSGQEPFPGEAHLADYLAECVAAGTMSATTDTADAVYPVEADARAGLWPGGGRGLRPGVLS
jgi:UDP-N-acetyl-D-mannosaminuronate dehydrogenase